MLPRIWERDAPRGISDGIHDSFLKDPVFRESQLEHDWTEEFIEWRKKRTFDISQ